jgi:hypothetical protein
MSWWLWGSFTGTLVNVSSFFMFVTFGKVYKKRCFTTVRFSLGHGAIIAVLGF